MHKKTPNMKKKYTLLFILMLLLVGGASAQALSGIDIWPGAGSSFAFDFTSFNGKVYFNAQADTLHGYELWVSDGTQAGTSLVKDIWPGPGSSSPYYLTVVGSQLFFEANDSIHGYELWVSDGTSSGTHMVMDILPGLGSSDPFSITPYNGKLYFTAADNIHGSELWVSDGTLSGTSIVKDILPGPGSSRPQGYTTSPGGYYKEIYNVINGKMYFLASDSIHGEELWVSDGTTAGTAMVADILPGIGGSIPIFMTALGSQFVFSAIGDTMNGRELYISDGTQAGTSLLKNINPGTNSSNIGGDVAEYSGFMVMNGKAYFNAHQAATGYELWVTDGSSAGTTLVKDILPGPGGSYAGYPYNLTMFNSKLYFGANDSVNGYQLWASDGTEAGTALVKVLSSYTPFNSLPNDFLIYNDQLLFIASTDSVNQYQLFTSDGTGAGTHVIAPAISPNPNPLGNDLFQSLTPKLVAANGAVYMDADFNSIGDELWIYGFPTGITPISGDGGITAYPNPFSKAVTVSGLDAAQHYTIQVLDLTGREYVNTQYQNPSQSITLSLPALSTGVYLMRVSGGGTEQTFKLVRE
jgi:ELWxxDGT repeat protein